MVSNIQKRLCDLVDFMGRGGGYSWSFDFVEIWVVVLFFDIGIKTDLHFDSPMISPPDIKS